MLSPCHNTIDFGCLASNRNVIMRYSQEGRGQFLSQFEHQKDQGVGVKIFNSMFNFSIKTKRKRKLKNS